MSNPNQNPKNPQMMPGLDPSKIPIQFNPSNLASLTGGQFLPSMANLTSAFGGGSVGPDYGHFMPGELAQSELIKKLREKFAEMKEEVEKMEKNPEKFKTHQLPLARIKKIMKSDEDVRMISAEAPVLFAKACELFIVELTHRAWIHTEEGKRRTLQKNDVAQCIANTDIFDFLIDIIPREEYAKTAIMKKSSMMNAFSNQVGYGGPGGMPLGMPGGMPGNMPANMPNGMPGGMPSGMPTGMPGGMPGGMGGLGFNPQMMQGANMSNPNQQNPNANKNPNPNPTAFMPQNMMFMQNMGMMGGPGDKNLSSQKGDQ